MSGTGFGAINARPNARDAGTNEHIDADMTFCRAQRLVLALRIKEGGSEVDILCWRCIHELGYGISFVVTTARTLKIAVPGYAPGNFVTTGAARS